jgi:hypothetical protein
VVEEVMGGVGKWKGELREVEVGDEEYDGLILFVLKGFSCGILCFL